jgi:hypothetical protein
MSCQVCGKRVRPKQRKHSKQTDLDLCTFCSAACAELWEAGWILAQLHKYEVMSTYDVPTQIMLQR